ncbi:hypothetical protein [Actinacidiphila acidipaludis]|uniref:Lipoprotein n=1 Tax=Actinacidiphila acidipaludis TaxID=2873382 RepID=A0ABS7PZL8_9ACTN|nr:hypothetical protein [Streptomyces acidipaludis]MBY8876298.1 hypothetical protein [Streptomyces acidipaludis]
MYRARRNQTAEVWVIGVPVRTSHPEEQRPVHHRPTLICVIAGLVTVVLAGCGGGSGTAAGQQQKGPAAASVPAQVLPSAPDPGSIRVPTGAPAASATAEPLPTGPTLELSPLDLWRRTAAVMADQKSASLTLDFRDEQGRAVHAESSVAGNGDCVGHVSAGGGQAQVIHVGMTPYLKGDAAFLTWAGERNGDADLLVTFSGRWLKGAPAQLGAYDIEEMCSLSTAVGNVTADFDGLKQERGPLTVAGRQVVSLTQTGDTSSVTLYVAASGPAVVVKAVRKGGTDVTTTFANLGRAVHAKAPAGTL